MVTAVEENPAGQASSYGGRAIGWIEARLERLCRADVAAGGAAAACRAPGGMDAGTAARCALRVRPGREGVPAAGRQPVVDGRATPLPFPPSEIGTGFMIVSAGKTLFMTPASLRAAPFPLSWRPPLRPHALLETTAGVVGHSG